MTDKPLQQKPIHRKRLILVGVATVIAAIIALVINQSRNAIVCNNPSDLRNENSAYIENATLRQPIDITTANRIERLASFHVFGWQAPSSFQVQFSPDNSMLALSNLNNHYPDVYAVLIWRLNQMPICILQAGDGEFTTPWQHFVTFSVDNKLMMLYQDSKCPVPPSLSDYPIHCLSIWDTYTNRLVDQYFAGRFVAENNQLKLEFLRTHDHAPETGNNLWQKVSQPYSVIEIAIDRSQLRLVNPITKKLIRTIQSSGDIQSAQISSNGRLLALGVNQKRDDKYPAYVELWAVKANNPITN